jgi:hypothetical protein
MMGPIRDEAMRNEGFRMSRKGTFFWKGFPAGERRRESVTSGDEIPEGEAEGDTHPHW